MSKTTTAGRTKTTMTPTHNALTYFHGSDGGRQARQLVGHVAKECMRGVGSEGRSGTVAKGLCEFLLGFTPGHFK